MIILQIILPSALFAAIFITFHFLFLYLLSFKKTTQIILPFILANLICFYFVKDTELVRLFLNSFIINLAILIIYMEFLLLIKMGFTLSIITLFKKKKNYSIKK